MTTRLVKIAKRMSEGGLSEHYTDHDKRMLEIAFRAVLEHLLAKERIQPASAARGESASLEVFR